MADEPIKLGSVNLNTPPPYGKTNGRHIVGSSPTAGTAWVNHAGEYAEEDGNGGYRFTGKAHMASMSFRNGPTLYNHDGTNLVAVTDGTSLSSAISGQMPSPAEPATDGEILVSADDAWVVLDPPAVAGTFKLRLVTAGDPVDSWTFSWQADA